VHNVVNRPRLPRRPDRGDPGQRRDEANEVCKVQSVVRRHSDQDRVAAERIPREKGAPEEDEHGAKKPLCYSPQQHFLAATIRASAARL
jgi:hypothetical protein